MSYTITLTPTQILDFAELARHLACATAPHPLPDEDAMALLDFAALLPATTEEEGDAWLESLPTFTQLQHGQKIRYGGEFMEIDHVGEPSPLTDSIDLHLTDGRIMFARRDAHAVLAKTMAHSSNPSPDPSQSMTTAPGCVFCSIVAGKAPADVVREWDDAIAIRPRSGGVADGHLLVIPRTHVADVGADPAVSAITMARAAELAAELPAANVITSRGAAATQTVYHLHVHVVPRVADDGLPLPWTPQQTARAAEVAAEPQVAEPHWTLGTTPANARLICAREPIPEGPSVFLAGPTPDRKAPVPSWRPDAIAALAEQWTGTEPLIVLSPESRGRVRADRYEDQVAWETQARATATAILFWIPRDMATLPGMTTNVEFGLDVPTGRTVLGCPPDCPNPERNRYLIYVARRHDASVCTTLADTVTAALAIVGARPTGSAQERTADLERHSGQADIDKRAVTK